MGEAIIFCLVPMLQAIEKDRQLMLECHYWEQDEFEREMIRLEALEMLP